MCGIAGIFHYAEAERPVDRDLLIRMTRRLAHRGPDGEGVFIDGAVGLGNRRLAIIDLTTSGHQPMTDAAGSCLTYNGEFYNHLEFRPQLESKGHRFRGTSDTETLLLLLAQYGPGILTDIAGIFSFAFWDARHRRLILGRDPLGVKQLYYHDNGRRIVFGSEVKALLECADVPREPDAEAVNQYVHFHTPLFEKTFFKDIDQVRAGEYLEVGRHGIHRRVYWETDGFEPRHETPADSVEQLRELLQRVVGQQLMSDVPVGAFFSGGIDSSAVAAFAKKSGRLPLLFGLHFANQNVIDERPYQVAAAKALGLDLELTTVPSAHFPEDFMRLMYFQDYPVIGPAMIPMYYVSRLAAGRVKVCLGGQAADEVFGGYARYALVHPVRVARSWLSGRRAVGSAEAPSPDLRVGRNLTKQLFDLTNLRRISRVLLTRDWATRYFDHFVKISERQWKRVLPAEGFVSRDKAWAEFQAGLARSPAKEPGDRILHWEMQTYLTGLFQQDDRMSMANSLESRVPLADPRVVRFALHTGFHLKLRGGATKWILRQAVSDVIPEWVLNRRKVGFDTPAEAWFRGPQQGFVRDLLLSSEARQRGYWDPAAIERALGDDNSPHWFDLVWKLASIEAWARTFIDQKVSSSAPALSYQSA